MLNSAQTPNRACGAATLQTILFIFLLSNIYFFALNRHSSISRSASVAPAP
jgi:hypothetical protein